MTTAGTGPAGRALALLVAGALFMELLDGTIIATAAPSIAASFGVQSADVGVAMTAYLLTVAIVIPISGWLADRWGARTLFTLAIVIFTVASGLCAVAVDLPMLTLMRVVQGIGGALMVPVGRLVVLRSTAKSDLIAAIAYLTWPALAAPVIAPGLGGLITTYSSWHVIFLINVPLGLVAFVAALRLVPDIRGAGPARLDWLGFLLCAACLAATVYSGALLSRSSVALGPVALVGAVGLVTGLLAVWHLRRRTAPLLQLSVLRVTTFRVSHSSGLVFRIAINAVPFLLPLMFQDAFGWTPLQSGIAVVFVFVGNIAIKPLTSPLLRRFGFRTVLVGSGVAAALTVAACALLQPGWSLSATFPALFGSGVFRSVSFTAYNTIAFADVSEAELTPANTLASTIQQLGVGLGVAVAALSLRASEAALGAGPGQPGPYRLALLVVAALLTAAGIAAVRVPGDAGAATGAGSGRRPVPLPTQRHDARPGAPVDDPA
jgi:EmrB/QacA subfamily drug resistance transporter